jgi:hypothetical protein
MNALSVRTATNDRFGFREMGQTFLDDVQLSFGVSEKHTRLRRGALWRGHVAAAGGAR